MISESTFIDRIKKEFPDAIENQTKSYISFQVKNMKGKLQNFIEINFQNKGIKIAILSKTLRDSDFLIFKMISYAYILQAEKAGLIFPSIDQTVSSEIGKVVGYGVLLKKWSIQIPQKASSYSEFNEMLGMSEKIFRNNINQK